MPIDIINESTTNAMGGTELMAFALQERLPPDLLDKFQIIPSRVRTLDPTRKRILWCHDLPGDPESDHLANGGYNKFERIVFVSNWQMQRYIEHYSIPWYKCAVIQNAIVPLRRSNEQGQAVKLVYHTTPHRGLDILATVFDKLCEKHDDIHLSVYSSFKLYGWEQRDEQYRSLFDFIKAHPKMTYYGAVSNEKIHQVLPKHDIFAYPSTWLETSCISLIEAMSAGLLCVHPNLGALPETAANWTMMYQYNDNQRDHAKMFYNVLDNAIAAIKSQSVDNRLFNQSAYTELFYSWDLRAAQWEMFLRSLS